MSNFASLVLAADTTGLDKGTDSLDQMTVAGGRTEKAVGRVGDKAEIAGKKTAAMGNAARMAARALAALGVGVSIGSIATLASRGAAEIDRMAKASRRLETSIGGFRAMELAAGEAGVAVGTLTDAVQSIDRELSRGGKNATEAMKKLGLAASDLAGSDADVKLALIADKVAALGLSTGQASALLQDLGVRNREMVLAIISGGDAFRKSRADIEDYGLAISSVDAAAIEAANDAIGRVSLAGQYLAQQLSLELTPALGRMATAFTDSLREGGLLRAVLDGIVGNLARVGTYIATAATGFGVYFVGALVAAQVATFNLAAAMVFLKGAIARTGFGLLVVGAGELVYWLGRVSAASSGVSAALGSIYDVGKATFLGIGNTAWGLMDILAGVASSIVGSFVRAFAEIAKSWDMLVNGMANAWNALASSSFGESVGLGMLGNSSIGATIGAVADGMFDQAVDSINQGGQRIKAAGAGVAAAVAASVKPIAGAADDGRIAADKLAGALDGVADSAGDGSGGAAGGLSKVKDAAIGLRDELNGPLGGAIDNLGNAFGEFLTGGIRNFKDFAKSIIDGFKRMISQMIATAIANPIKLALGLGGSVAGGAAAAGTAGGGGNGLLGGLLGGKLFGCGGMIPGIWGGLKGIFTGGGLGSSFANLGGLVTGTSSGFGALGAALPALGIVAGGIALLVNGLSKKYNGRAVRGSLGPEGFDGTEFDFWNGGFLRGDSVEYMDVRTEIQKELDDTAIAIRTSVKDMAKALGAGSAAIDGFVGDQFTIWLTGPAAGDQAEIAAQLEAELTKLGDGMAGMIPGLSKFQREGEGAYDALMRMGEGILAVNDAADILGHRMWDISLASGDAASELVELFGGLDAMTAAVGVYWQAFYTDAERAETTIRRLRQTFADLGQVMPESRDQYRAMVEAIDTTTDAGRKLYAEMIGLAGALDQVLPEVAEFTIAMQGIISQIGGEIGSQIDIARDMAADAKASAQLWYRTANTLRDFIRDLTNSPLTLASPAQQFAVNRNRFNTAFDLVKGGDVDAAQDMPDLAKNYLESIKASSTSEVEYRREAAKVMAAMKLAAGIADIEGSNDDILRALYEKQIKVLTNLGLFLKLDGIDADLLKTFDKGTRKLIKDFDGTVGSYEKVLKQIGKAIADAKDFSYDKLLADLDITLKFADKSTMPDWVKALVKDAGDKIKVNLDFILRRDDLTPDMKWIATNSLSQHVKNLKFILKQDLDDQTRAIALATSSGLLRTLNLVVGKDLDPDTKRLALMANSDLTRTVGAVLAKKMDPKAKKLALAGIGAYDVAVRAALSWPDISKKTQKLVFQDGSQYAVLVTAALNLDKTQRRILLKQLGDYAVNVTATLATDMRPKIKELILQANTTSIRGITIAAAFGDKMDPEKRALLLKQSTRAQRIIKAVVNPAGIDALGLVFLDQLVAGIGSVSRDIDGTVNVGKMKPREDDYFAQITAGNGGVVRKINGDIATGKWEPRQKSYFGQITAGDGSVSRSITGGLFVGDMPGKDGLYFGQITKGDGSTYRSINGGVTVGDLGWTKERFLWQLFAGAGTVSRKIDGGVNMPATGIDYLGQLFAGAGTVSRKVDGGVTVGELGWTKERFLWQLFAGAGTVSRGIAGSVDTLGIVGIGQQYMGQLFAGTGNVLRKILGGVLIGNLSWSSEKYFHQLAAGPGTISRKIIGGVDTTGIAGLDIEYLGQLLFGPGSVSRSINGKVFVGDLSWSSEKFFHQLAAGNGFISRAINGGVSVGDLSWTNEKFLGQLIAGAGSVYRSIAGKITTGTLSWSSEKFLHQIVAGDGFVQKTINGIVDIDGLDARQLALLDAITGADAGKLTVYGGFKFEPSEAFAAWFEGSFKTIATPMDALRAGLAELRAAVVGQTEAAEKAAIVAALDREAGKMLRNDAGQYVATPAQIEKLARLAGVSLSGSVYTQAGRVKDFSGIDLLDDIYVDRSGYQTKMLLKARVGTAGLRVDPAGYLAAYPGVGTNFAGTPQEHFERHGRAEILFGIRTFEPGAFDWSSIGLDIPGFAGGGLHSGGLRMVGERGPELEITGPSRIVSNSEARSMLDMRDVVRELAEVRRELAGMRDEQRQLGLAEVKHGKRTADAITKWDKIGMPETQT